MRPFVYQRALKETEAIQAVAGSETSAGFIGGGTSLLDLMKIDVVRLDKVVDINRIEANKITTSEKSTIIGAMAKNSEVAHDDYIVKHFPVLSQAILNGASVQLRNMATVGGNIMQRSRCPYFRDTTMACNKREPGTGCPAQEGFSRLHAILGVSDHCISAHPSDMCVALEALDATIHTLSSKGTRQIPLSEFYLVPGDTPHLENVLRPGELIVAVEIPHSGTKFSAHSHYLKIRDRSSYTFAIVSAAVCLELDGKLITDARVVLGGVGTKPWRVPSTEKLLIGNQLTSDLFRQAAQDACAGARTSKFNKFKTELTKRTIVRALESAAGI